MFPHPETADKDGLLAMGGDLTPWRLLLAYRFGIFPWFNEGDPILWWSPDPRCVLYPHDLKISKSMRRLITQKPWRVTINHDFHQVISACQMTRRHGQGGTWITDDMLNAYLNLHQLGYAHSVEVWQSGQLIGGLYGLRLGSIFFGESMFTEVSNASKYGFITWVKFAAAQGIKLIDCQQDTTHLRSLGAITIPRSEFLLALRQNNRQPDQYIKWSGELTSVVI